MFRETYPNLLRAAQAVAQFGDVPLDDVLEFMEGVAKLHSTVQLNRADDYARCLPDDILVEYAAGDVEAGKRDLKSLLKFKRGMTQADWLVGERTFRTLVDAGGY